jgi:hypothetical protein
MTTKIKAFAPPINQEYAPPDTCSYLHYRCSYCLEEFKLVEPENGYRAGGCIKTIQYRHKKNDEIVAENRIEGVCRRCLTDIMRRQQE